MRLRRVEHLWHHRAARHDERAAHHRKMPAPGAVIAVVRDAGPARKARPVAGDRREEGSGQGEAVLGGAAPHPDIALRQDLGVEAVLAGRQRAGQRCWEAEAEG